MGPKPPAAATMETDMPSSQPSLRIWLRVMEPMAAASALAEPEMPAMRTPVTMVVYATPPRINPTSFFAKLTSVSVIWVASMICPPSMKKGTAIRAKESFAVKTFWASTRGCSPLSSKMAMAEAPPIAMAMGKPIKRRTKNNSTINPIILIHPPPSPAIC